MHFLWTKRICEEGKTGCHCSEQDELEGQATLLRGYFETESKMIELQTL